MLVAQQTLVMSGVVEFQKVSLLRNSPKVPVCASQLPAVVLSWGSCLGSHADAWAYALAK